MNFPTPKSISASFELPLGTTTFRLGFTHSDAEMCYITAIVNNTEIPITNINLFNWKRLKFIRGLHRLPDLQSLIINSHYEKSSFLKITDWPDFDLCLKRLTYITLPTDMLPLNLSPFSNYNHWYRSRRKTFPLLKSIKQVFAKIGYDTIVNCTIAMSALLLPDYCLMWILGWLPCVCLLSDYKKIQLISGIRRSKLMMGSE